MFISPLTLLSILGCRGRIVESASKVIIGLSLSMKVHGVQGALTDGLLRLYRGDGSTNDSANSGIALTGETGYSQITFPQSGRTRQVFNFDNSLGLTSPATGLPAGASDRTMMGWFLLRTTYSANGDPFGYGSPGGVKAYYIDIYVSQSATAVELNMYSGDEGVNPIIAPNTFVYDKWFHLACTYSSADNTNTVYLDGALLATGISNPVPATSIDGTGAGILTSRFYMAQQFGSLNYRGAYDGQVADVAIFDRVLDAAEVQLVYSDDSWGLSAGGGGDPHFYGFSGKFFTWQGHCDVVLVKIPKVGIEDDNVEVHIRTKRVRQWSSIDGIALKVGTDVGEIESSEGNFIFNGSQVESISTDKMTVEKSTLKSFSSLQKKILLYKFIFGGDKVLEVKINTRTNIIDTTLSGNYPKETTGIVGSPTKPGLVSREGENMNDKDVNTFMESWQVNSKDPQLFHKYRHPQHPSKCLYNIRATKLDNLHTGRRLKKSHKVTMKEAEAACDTHHYGPLKQFCIDDVSMTGNFEFAEDKFYG